MTLLFIFLKISSTKLRYIRFHSFPCRFFTLIWKSSRLRCFFFFAISTQDPLYESIEKVFQSPGPDHPCYVRMKKWPAILKTLICSTASGIWIIFPFYHNLFLYFMFLYYHLSIIFAISRSTHAVLSQYL